MFFILAAIFSAVAGLTAGAALVTPAAHGGIDLSVGAVFSTWLANWWAKFQRLRKVRRQAFVRATTATHPPRALNPEEEDEELPDELKQVVDDINKLLKISVAASSVVAALLIVKIIGVLVRRQVVQKETIDRGLERLFKMVEWVADFGFIALFFWGNGKEEFAALQRVLGVIKRTCFRTGTFNIDVPDAMLSRVGLGSYAGTWNRLKRNRWRVVGILVAIIALSVVSARAWKKVSKKGGFRRFVTSLWESDEEPSVAPIQEKKKKVKRKGAYMGSGDGDGGRGRRVDDDGPVAVDPERVHALPPFRNDSSGEIPLYNKDGSLRAMAGSVSHDGSNMVVTIAHAVRDEGAYWDTAGQQQVKVISYFNEDKDDAIAVVKPPSILPRAAKTIAMKSAHASALIWKDGAISSGSVFQADEGKLRHTCGTLPGHSGSLVFAFVDGRWAAVGVHSGSSATHNIAYSFF